MTDDLSRTIEAQAHRLYSIDVEHTLGDMTVKTSYFFHDVPLTPPAQDTEIEVNTHADLDTTHASTQADSETKAMRRYATGYSTSDLSNAVDRINVKIDSLEQQIFNLKTMMLKA